MPLETPGIGILDVPADREPMAGCPVDFYFVLLVKWLLVYCYSPLGALRVRPANVTLPDTAA